MPKHHTLLHRDANETELVSLWRRVDCLWIPMPREAGFDGVLVCPRTGVHFVEIKNPERKWKLTKTEQNIMMKLMKVGCGVNIVETELQAKILVGLG